MNSSNIRMQVLCALFAAFCAVCSQLTIPIQPVPITLGTFAVLLAGGFLGSRYGLMSIVIYLLLGAAGVPYPEKDGISIYSPIALVKGAANMDNGKLLYDFILSKEGQDVLVANNLLSVRKDIKQRDVTIEEIAAHAMNIDLATLAANANKVLDDFDAIFKKK